jgi:hypothetical protein
MDVNVRRSWHCGWMPESEWTQCQLPARIGDEVYDLEVCPGWLVRQDAVAEGSRAYAAFDKGELSTLFPEPTNALLEATEAASQSFNKYQSYKLRENAKKREQSQG